MASSAASTVEAYLSELPDDRRQVVAAVRALVNRNLPDGYVETMGWGMISWGILLSRYPGACSQRPLMYAALAAQKNHYAPYLMNAYSDSGREHDLRSAYAAAGQKFDMGKGCLRFRKLDEPMQPAVARAIASTPVEAYIARYEASRVRN